MHLFGISILPLERVNWIQGQVGPTVERTVISRTVGTETLMIGIVISPCLVVYVPFDYEAGVWKEDEVGTFHFLPIRMEWNIEGFVVIREFLYDVEVIVMKSAGVRDKLDVVVTKCVQFSGPELVMRGVVSEVDEGGYSIEFSLT